MSPPLPRLSERQAEVLRRLAAEGSPVPRAELDGRVLRALERHVLIEPHQDAVTLTVAGTEYFNTQLRRRRRVGVRLRWLEQAPREAILEAVETLKTALPTSSKLFVGDLRVSGEEVIGGLVRYAEQLPQGCS